MKISREVKNKITSDWSTAFPNLSIYESLWLLKRYGPIIVGVCLNLDSGDDKYLPISHLHNLCNGAEYLTISLKTELKSHYRNVPSRILAKNHERDWAAAAEELKRQSFVPFKQDGLAFSQVRQWYLDYMEIDPLARYSPKIFEDIYSLQIYCGRTSQASQDLLYFKKIIDSWPDSISKKIGGSSKWAETTIELFPSQEFVTTNANNLVKRLHLENVQVGKFDCKG